MFNEKNYKIKLNDMFSSLESEMKQKTDAINKELNKKIISDINKYFEEQLKNK